MTHLSYVPYFDGNYVGVQSEHLYTVSIHADMAKIRANKPPDRIPTKTRGKISTFSRKSRKRLIELMADEIRVPDLFVTLTFSDDFYENWINNYKPCLEAFRRRLERAYPNIAAIWRVEIENRKSGEWIGEPMPHFHLIVWLPDNMKNCADLIVEKHKDHHWARWWHEITGSTHKEHLERRGCDISRIKSRRHGYHYVSKYATKTSDDEIDVGRRWGRFGSVGQGSRADVIINRREYIELKRLIVSYQKRLIMRKNKDTQKWEAKRNKQLAQKTARQSNAVGLTAFGLGVWNSPNFDVTLTTIMKMIKHAKELVAIKS